MAINGPQAFQIGSEHLDAPAGVAHACVKAQRRNQVRLASRDHYRLTHLANRAPGKSCRSFVQRRALVQRHRSKLRWVSHDAEFLRWLMDREWNRPERAEATRNSRDRRQRCPTTRGKSQCPMAKMDGVEMRQCPACLYQESAAALTYWCQSTNARQA